MFAREYIIDFNGTRAAIASGYSKHTANRIADQNLNRPQIQAAITASINARIKRTEITADYVLTSLRNVAERCMQAEAVLDREGNPTGEYRFDSTGANKSLELLGKYLKLFTDKTEHSGSIDINMSEQEIDVEISTCLRRDPSLLARLVELSSDEGPK